MTANVRLMLEACTKAAGTRHIIYTNGYDGRGGLMLCAEHGRHTESWNPLASLEDAADMAIKPKIGVSCEVRNATLVVTMLGASGYAVSLKGFPTEREAYCYAICKVAELYSQRRF